MSKLFISYRRKSWPFTHRLAEELGKRLDADIFVDYTGVDETDFEQSILRHLRESDAVLLVISEHTFADRIHRDDDWVRREIRDALTRKIPLALVCVEGLLPPPGLPDDIKDVARMQGINFYPDFFTPAVERLAEFVVKIGAAGFRGASNPSPASNSDESKTIEGRTTLDEALDLLEHEDYNKAIFLLEALREQGYKSRFVDIQILIERAKAHQESADRRRRALLEYDEIVALAARKFTQEQAQSAFNDWCADYSELVIELDTAKLAERFRPAPPKPARSKVYDILPSPFEWIDIPAGKVTLIAGKGWSNNYIPEGQSRTFDVPAFAIAKYPVTNAQFRKFIEAGGYRQKNWWTDAGWQTKEKEKWKEPRYWQESKWNGAQQPVVGVSWYEAIAFCQWLSEISDENILLPTEQQWQRAAQGDDGRAYPWGNAWDCERCNNSVTPCNSNITTPVTHYAGKGDSPFGVVDIAGNVWEWCLTKYKTGGDNLDGTDVRVLRGGSWNVNGTVYFRCVYRDGINPDFRYGSGGFRVSRS